MTLTREFDYPLPEDLIASHPLDKRDSSRLMVLDRKTQKIEHRHFFDIVDLLNKDDVLVLNDTKVIPARLEGKKIKGGELMKPFEGGGKIEVLLLKRLSDKEWECLIQPAKRVKKGYEIDFGKFTGSVTEEIDDSRRKVKFDHGGDFDEIIAKEGQVPLPPYIRERLSEKEQKDKNIIAHYQTVYAAKEGASAAPTAGLHFTDELLEKIKKKGVKIVYITLHTGVGTFRPVMVEDVKDHKMFEEEYEIPLNTAEEVNRVLRQRSQVQGTGSDVKRARIAAVGTTVVRALEDCFSKHGKVKAVKDEAEIFIYPPFKFKVVNSLITNFHFPRSTLLMLVSAFAGQEFIKKAYGTAVKEKYRFYSFGDATVIL